MQDLKGFRENGHKVIDWLADYFEKIESFPVKSKISPGEIHGQISKLPPLKSDNFDQIMNDLEQIILPGITHWQHPNFHAFFPGNSSYVSVLAELLTAGIGAQCMMWETSPAAAELEERMMGWFKEMMDLPSNWEGVIHDTASVSTLTALICARELKTGFRTNTQGFSNGQLRIYCSTETHSSIEKAVKIAGFGSENLVKIEVDDRLAMISSSLERAIEEDIDKGFTPCCVIGTLGTTSTLAVDPIPEIGSIALHYNLWYHIDAAYLGTALLLPEMSDLRKGLELANSYVFNPHKWMFTNFDCSILFVNDKNTLLNTFQILPEYLKTNSQGKMNDYRDWGIALGRRFRALKLWFVIRDFGIEGLQKRIRDHLRYAQWLEDQIEMHPEFELIAERKYNLVVFRYHPKKHPVDLNILNQKLLKLINDSGSAYLTHTKINDIYALRLVAGQTYLQMSHITKVWKLIVDLTNELSQEN